MNISSRKINFSTARWAKDWRLLSPVLIPLSLILFLSLATPYNPLSTSAFVPLRSFFLTDRRTIHLPTAETSRRQTRSPLNGSRIAVCLVGGARRFELTGPSIVKNILEVYPDADLFLHSPYDKNSFKFLLLNVAPRIAWIRIFEPKPMPESESQLRVLSASNSPNGIQGLLQYFNLVEGCLTMIKTHQQQNNFTYNWIIRTRVDSYWNAPLNPAHFIPGKYIVPSGSSYGGLNDRLGIGDLTTSEVALSRLALIPQLDLSGLHQLNSETSFRGQLATQNVTYATHRLPFCIVSDRQYVFPPKRYDVPVAAMSSLGPLSGAKCRPCKAICKAKCVAKVMPGLERGWSWTDWENGSLELCDARGEWEKGWEKIFDRTVGPRLARSRKKIWSMNMMQCVAKLEEMRRRSQNWEAPAAEEICKLGLG